MTISGGNVRILDASDDGLNTGGSDSGSYAMTITGGYIYVNASGDGVDSNSTWEMSGGTLLVCGPTSGGDGSLDANGNMTYTGGTLLALSSKGMMEYPESGCLIATNCNAAAGEQISIVEERYGSCNIAIPESRFRCDLWHWRQRFRRLYHCYRRHL